MMHSIPLLEIRFFLYDLLRQVFLQEPDESFFKRLQDIFQVQPFPLEEEDEKIASGVKSLRPLFYAAANESAGFLEDVKDDYTRLLIGPDRLPAPPWESVYSHEDRLLFQAETLAVRKRYLKYGFTPAVPGSEAEDHIGLELDFMAKLTEMTLQAVKASRAAEYKMLLLEQRDFLTNHLLQWTPTFCRDFIAAASNDFYRGFAILLEGLLHLDLQALDELLQEINM